MKSTVLLPVVLLAVAVSSLLAADDHKAWADPESAQAEDPDFSIQGEYGEPGGEMAFGVQVVALGDGKFEAYFLEGGLPGMGWTPEKKRIQVQGSRAEDGTAFFGPGDEGIYGKYNDGTLAAKWGDEERSLTRLERKSPTLGAKAPDGAVVLFDGTDAEQWKNGKVEHGLLAATGAISIPTFKDCTVHIEFRTPYVPKARGQARGNSGVYYAGRWETQVLDSFGLSGENNECGGIYSIAKPRLNMCFPPLSWQTYDTEYTAPKFDADGKRTAWAKVTVRLNGVVIHEEQELPTEATGSAPIGGELKDEGGPIHLQAHGNPVFYRNIWVVPKG